MAKGIRQMQDVHSNVQDKKAEALKKSKIYSTERINQIMEELSKGGSPDMDPFWHGQMQFRDNGITFEYTEEELAIMERCSVDPVYFVSNYCTFRTDAGRTLVKLRDYQVRTLKMYGEEIWDEVTQTLIPKNRKIAIMQSRQSGKCVKAETEITIIDDEDKTFSTNITTMNKEKYNIWRILWKTIKDKLKRKP